MKKLLAVLMLLALWLGLSACATLSPVDEVHVSLVGIEPIESEGMELRMAVKLRIQNPGDAPIPYDGVALNLELRGHDFATGVSDQRGTVPRFGESVITVPVTVGASAMVRQVFSLINNKDNNYSYVARGKLGGSAFASTRFESRGDVKLSAPAALPAPAPAKKP